MCFCSVLFAFKTASYWSVLLQMSRGIKVIYGMNNQLNVIQDSLVEGRLPTGKIDR